MASIVQVIYRVLEPINRPEAHASPCHSPIQEKSLQKIQDVLLDEKVSQVPDWDPAWQVEGFNSSSRLQRSQNLQRPNQEDE
jgi:hypothetical protein